MSNNEWQVTLDIIENMIQQVNNARTNVSQAHALLSKFNQNQLPPMLTPFSVFLNTMHEHLQSANQSVDTITTLTTPNPNEKVQTMLKHVLNSQGRKLQKQAVEVESLIEKYDKKQYLKKRSQFEAGMQDRVENKKLKTEHTEIRVRKIVDNQDQP
jgi:hypothetical protein